MVEEGFLKADSLNLPNIDVEMIATFVSKKDFTGVEAHGIKAIRSGRDTYGDHAVGRVQLKRSRGLCIVKAQITPEHKVHSIYNMEAKINKKQHLIKEIECKDCAAAKGGCKHVIAFLMWLHRRSEEPSPTETACYWRKSTMSKVGNSLKSITVAELAHGFAQSKVDYEKNSVFVQYLAEADKRGSKPVVLDFYKSLTDNQDPYNLSLHNLALKNISKAVDADDFIIKCNESYNTEICRLACQSTIDQSKNSLWFELKFGRITASKVYDAAHCKTPDGSLMQTLMGARKFKPTEAMNRGLKLEDDVRKIISKKMNVNIVKFGLILKKGYVIFGASPDGLAKDFVLEIKSPTSLETKKNYVNARGVINKQFIAQMQLQMLFAKKQKALFVITPPNFEKLNEKEKLQNIETYWVDFDKNYVEDLLGRATIFWKNVIFPHLKRIYDLC